MRALRFGLWAVLVTALPLFAREIPTISSISPNAVHIENGEWFVTINGTHFLPLSGVSVNFSGPAGSYTILPQRGTDTSMVVWVPGPPLINPGTYTVTVSAPDGFGGKLTSNSTTFIVIGRIVWFIDWQTLWAIEATSLDGAIGRFSINAQSLFSDVVTVDCDHKSGDFFAYGRTVVNCVANDDLGNGTKQSFTVDVEDTTPPDIKTPFELTAFGSLEGTNVKFDVTASDVVDTAVLPPTCTPASGDFFRIGTTKVTCTAYDRFKNESSASFRVHVGSDTGIPALIVPESVTAEAASLEGQYVKWEVTASDVKGNAADWKCDPAPGSLFPIGTTTVTCIADAGGTARESFPVNVVDTTGPVLSLPQDISVQAPTIDGEYVRYSVTAQDAVSGAMEVSCFPASGSLFAPGDTVVNCSSMDKYRNTTNGTFNVHVEPWFDDTVYATPKKRSSN